VLKAACSDTSVPKKAVFNALRVMQKAKAPTDGWDKAVGGNDMWRLVYTAGAWRPSRLQTRALAEPATRADKKSVSANMKDESAGSGSFFPLLALQRFDLSASPSGRIQNGVWVPHIASLRFRGPYTMQPNSVRVKGCA